MSEQNILNPTVAHPLNPSYGYNFGVPETDVIFKARSGERFIRTENIEGHAYELTWDKKQQADADTLKQWEAQYKRGFFTYQDFERARYFTGCFDGPLKFQQVGYNKVTVTGKFIELPLLPMYQYPSNWARDAIFLEERDDFGYDVVSLSNGVWDRRDRNYALWSEAFDNAAWTKHTGVTVTADFAAGPFDVGGATTADKIHYDGSGAAGDWRVEQVFTFIPKTGESTTASFYMRTTSGTLTVRIANNAGFVFATCNLTAAWTRFSVTATGDGSSAAQLLIYSAAADNAAFDLVVSAAQFEYGAAATTYAKTTAASALLLAPNANADLHGGFAYWNAGQASAALVELDYIGYGFKLWAPKRPYMGLAQVFLDGVFQSNVDQYAAAFTPSAALLTVQNVPFGRHRVGFGATGAKNAAASDYWVTFDALQVMR